MIRTPCLSKSDIFLSSYALITVNHLKRWNLPKLIYYVVDQCGIKSGLGLKVTIIPVLDAYLLRNGMGSGYSGETRIQMLEKLSLSVKGL